MKCRWARRVAVVLMLLVASPAAARPELPDRASECGRLLGVTTVEEEQAVERAVEHLLGFRMRDADAVLLPLARYASTAPAAQHLLAMGAFLSGLVSDRPEDFSRFDAHADTLETLLQELPATCWADYLRAETELQRGVVAVKQERYIRAAWHGRAAYKRYERAVRRHPQFVDLYKGRGLMHLGIGSLPGTWRRFLRILGYSGSVRQGLEELERTAEKGSIVNRDAGQVGLGLAYAMLGIDDRLALERLREVHLRHPESPFFGYLYAYGLLMERDASGAEMLLRRYAAQRDDEVHRYISFVDYYLGRSLFVQDRFDEAEPYLRSYLAIHEGSSLKASARLLLGQALEMQGRRQDAEAQYREVRVEREYDIDQVSQREATRRLDHPLTGTRRTLLLGANAYDSGRYERAASLLQPILASAEADREERVEAAFRLGRVAHALGALNRAMEMYTYVVEHARDPETKWAPWATLHIAEIHRAQGNAPAARAAYERALDYRGPYDFQQSLEQNARAALELLADER